LPNTWTKTLWLPYGGVRKKRQRTSLYAQQLPAEEEERTQGTQRRKRGEKGVFYLRGKKGQDRRTLCRGMNGSINFGALLSTERIKGKPRSRCRAAESVADLGKEHPGEAAEKSPYNAHANGAEGECLGSQHPFKGGRTVSPSGWAASLLSERENGKRGIRGLVPVQRQHLEGIRQKKAGEKKLHPC